VTAYKRLKRLDEWQTLVQEKIQKNPDELAYLRSAAELATYRGEMEKSREVARGIINEGKANEQDFNQYAWYAVLLQKPSDAETLDFAHRASDLTKNSNRGILHTLACVYAQVGKTSQRREYLLKAMDAAHLGEPDPSDMVGVCANCRTIRRH